MVQSSKLAAKPMGLAFVGASVASVLLQGCSDSAGGPTPAPAPGPASPTPAPTATPGPMPECPKEFKRGQCSQCSWTGSEVECLGCKDPYKLQDGACAIECPSDKPKKPGLPKTATQYNGVTWPTMCIPKAEAHFFTIGDWGGVCNFVDNICVKEQFPAPMVDPNGRKLNEVDGDAQVLVAKQMEIRAAKYQPEFLLNVGDNFYPGGVDDHCGQTPSAVPGSRQFEQIYEQVYDGEHYKDKEWWSVLGNHDYGGVCFIAGWDQQIYYTWGEAGRWIMPAQYWMRTVQFADFTADFFFLDTNVEDTANEMDMEAHNLCGNRGNTDKSWYCGTNSTGHMLAKGGSTCEAAGGPPSLDACTNWFQELNDNQMHWLAGKLRESEAEWQIVVTHFPPRFNKNRGRWLAWSKEYGIDLFVTGHTHFQQIYYKGTTAEADFDMGDTAWVVTGGGGGITSERFPQEHGNDDAYGFMDMKINKDTIEITAISHGGKIRNTTTITPRGRPTDSARTEISV